MAKLSLNQRSQTGVLLAKVDRLAVEKHVAVKAKGGSGARSQELQQLYDYRQISSSNAPQRQPAWQRERKA